MERPAHAPGLSDNEGQRLRTTGNAAEERIHPTESLTKETSAGKSPSDCRAGPPNVEYPPFRTVLLLMASLFMASFLVSLVS